MTIKIKNWTKFQHFKDRRPPWIKLHRDLLDQRDISLISDRSFRVLVGLWLLASEDEMMEGVLPPVAEIAWRLRFSESEIVHAIQELSGFIEGGDINLISDRYQVDTPETETETETKRVSTRNRNSVYPKPEEVDQGLWDAFVQHRKTKKAPITEIAMAGIYREAEKADMNLNDALREVIERNWQSFKAEWVNKTGKSSKPADDQFAGMK